MKIDRLISIIMILLERKKISAQQLAEMFEVTPRTIYRDIEAISLAGIPIITYPGVNGGIGIMEQFKIDKKLFTTSDIKTLLIGLGSISSTLSSEEIVNTLAKVKGLIPAEQIREMELKSNQITIDLTPWAGNKKLKPNLEIIKKALDERKFLSFTYSDREIKKSSRKIEPYQLILKGSSWYLQGYCTTRKDFRLFKLSRISALELLEENFIFREYDVKALRDTEWIEKRIFKIKLLVDEKLKERMEEYCEAEDIEAYSENKYIVYFPFVEDELGYNLLLSFGDKCECLEPESVRNGIIERVRNMIRIYK